MTTTEPTPTQTSDATREIPTRRMKFEPTLADVPKHFSQDGDLIGSHLTAMLSAVFPDGEDFFVRSVRHYRKDITDPALKEQVKGFIGQEAIHGREHRDLNDRLAELGYPTKRVERLTKWGLGLRSKYAPAKANLAATAALEHFTATLAETILSDQDARDRIGHQAVKDIFVWHALEESEHKAVAFDVYKAVGGSERLRVWTMKFLRYGFVLFTALSVIASMARDKASYNPRRLRASWKRFKTSAFASRELWEKLKDYDRPDFHPDDYDTRALEAEWRERLFGDAGSLNDLYTNRAA